MSGVVHLTGETKIWSDPVADPTNSDGCGTGEYYTDTWVGLTASPAVGWRAVSWTGTSDNSSTSTYNQVQMPFGGTNASVIYQPICYTLTLSGIGPGYDPTASPTSSTGCSIGAYHVGEVISLTAQPQSGTQVSSWSGTDNDASPSNANTLTMPASNAAVNVTYEEGSTATNINVMIGGSLQANYPDISTYKLDSYIGVNSGPLLVSDTNNNPLAASIKLLYKNHRTTTMSELMGVPTSQLAGEYWLPLYIDEGIHDSQLCFTNTSDSLATTVNVYLGDNPTPVYSVDLGPSEADRVHLGTTGGPVHIESTTPGANILAGMRIIYGNKSSFDEIMALPTTQLSDEYWFPFYNHNNVNLFTEVRIGVLELP
ncbi:MAG TPA: hypothetical protein VLA72_05065 [Anaerolineales bacterium]|nr:hypothetical protein [Anaerolineales bacterium]